jgi:hypothetical protein
MVIIRELYNSYYNVLISQPIYLLDAISAGKIVKEVKKIVHPSREIDLDISMVCDFIDSGYEVLAGLLTDAEVKQCKIRIWYYDFNITYRIQSFCTEQKKF